MNANLETAYTHFWQLPRVDGVKKCRKYGVGAFRKYLGSSPMSGNVVGIFRKPAADDSRRSAEQWRAMLSQLCAGCGGCKWAKK
jgi:hypothetical protein